MTLTREAAHAIAAAEAAAVAHELRRELRLAVDALGERLDTDVAELHRRVTEIHERALRELTRLHERRMT